MRSLGAFRGHFRGKNLLALLAPTPLFDVMFIWNAYNFIDFMCFSYALLATMRSLEAVEAVLGVKIYLPYFRVDGVLQNSPIFHAKVQNDSLNSLSLALV